ncbi:MAG: hypothetical protein HRF45_03485 [Fimbriimonadia bacterium]
MRAQPLTQPDRSAEPDRLEGVQVGVSGNDARTLPLTQANEICAVAVPECQSPLPATAACDVHDLVLHTGPHGAVLAQYLTVLVRYQLVQERSLVPNPVASSDQSGCCANEDLTSEVFQIV